MEDIDTSNGVMFIFYDPDTNIVFLAGKVTQLLTLTLLHIRTKLDLLLAHSDCHTIDS